VSRRTCAVLLEDPELGDELSEQRLREAATSCLAPTVSVGTGAWSPHVETARLRHGIGLLVLDGLLTRRVGVDGRFGAELLGSGDLVRPWQDEVAGSTLPHSGEWVVWRPTQMAVLDRDFVLGLAPYPEILAALFGRAVRRSRQLALHIAIVHQPRIDVRLHMFFWGLADRWGTVHTDGVRLRVNLTHAALAELLAATRPTVTKALGELAERGLVRWDGEAWLLMDRPPAEIGEIKDLVPAVTSMPAEPETEER
jgi:CRP-like cAMP-binding protein